jgi:hypothetical protein
MLNTGSIEQFEPHIPGLYAFRITGEVKRDDLEAMAKTMNEAFDHNDEVDMLVSFKSDEGAEFGAGLSLEAIKSQFRGLSGVRNYCVAQAPDNAAKVVDLFGKLLPVDAKTFSSEHNALQHLRAQPPIAA